MSCLGREIWLQVLLSLEAEALTAVACCQGHHLPALCELAAWLRSGLPRAEEVLGVKIGLPSRCHSWVQLLYQQMQGAWLCIVQAGPEAELVFDMREALARAEGMAHCDGRVQIALLPSTQHASGHVCIRKAVRIVGLSYEGSQVPTLCLQGLEVNSSEGCVEFQNCALSGLGTPEALPTGIGDCVLRVAAGACSLISCQLRMTKGHAGFGIVVGPHPSLDLKAQLRLRGTEVMHASTACVCFMGGLVTIEEGCSFRDCRVGISACDEGSCAMIVSKLQVLCREGGQRFEEVSGGLVVQRRESL